MALTPELEAQLGQIYGQNSGGQNFDVESQLKQIYGVQEPPTQSAFDGALTDIGRNTVEAFRNNATATGEAISEPWHGKNTPWYLRDVDLGMRTLGKVGNAVGGVYGAIASPVQGALTVSVENSGIIPASRTAIKQNLVPDDPRFVDTPLSPEQHHEIAQGIGGDLTNAAFMGAGGIQGKRFRDAKAGIPVNKPYNPITETIAPAVNKMEVASNNLPGMLGDTTSGRQVDLTPNIKQVAEKATQFYDFADAQKAALSSPAVDVAINNATKKAGYQTPEGLDFAGENLVTQTLNDLSRRKGNSLSLRGASEIDDIINDRISSAYRAGDHDIAGKLIEIRNTLRGAYKDASKEDIVNPEAFDAWRTGDELWTAKSKMQEMQSIIDNAYMTDNPVTSMRTGFRNLAKQVNKNPKGYTAEEVAAINKAAKTGIVTGALKVMGGRLISGITGAIGGAAGGGIPGALGGVAVGEAIAYPMRAAANTMQESRSTTPIKMVANRPGVKAALDRTISPSAPPKEPLQLTYQPEPKTVVVNSYGQAIPLSKSDRAIIGQSPFMKSMLQLATPEAKAAFAESWDKLTAEQQAKISAQTEKAWRITRVPLEDMILQAKQSADDLAAAKGSDINNPAMRDALVEAVKEPTLKEIMAMKPKDARAALENYKKRNQRR